MLDQHMILKNLKNISKQVCFNLNKIIDVNYYPTNKCKISNFKHILELVFKV